MLRLSSSEELARGHHLAPAAAVLQHELEHVGEGVVAVGVVLDRDDAVLVGDVLLPVLALERVGLDLGEGELRRLDAAAVGGVHDVAVHVDDVVGVLVDFLDVAVLGDESEAFERRVELGLDVGWQRRADRRGEDVSAFHALAGADVCLVVGVGLCHAAGSFPLSIRRPIPGPARCSESGPCPGRSACRCL